MNEHSPRLRAIEETLFGWGSGGGPEGSVTPEFMNGSVDTLTDQLGVWVFWLSDGQKARR